MREDLGFSTAELAWVENAYTLAFGGLLLPGARTGVVNVAHQLGANLVRRAVSLRQRNCASAARATN